jgi:hypothetical protein
MPTTAHLKIDGGYVPLSAIKVKVDGAYVAPTGLKVKGNNTYTPIIPPPPVSGFSNGFSNGFGA